MDIPENNLKGESHFSILISHCSILGESHCSILRGKVIVLYFGEKSLFYTMGKCQCSILGALVGHILMTHFLLLSQWTALCLKHLLILFYF